MGPPQNFIITTTNSSLNLTWSRPDIIFLPQFDNIIIDYYANCSNNFIEKNSSKTSIVINEGIEPGHRYSCFVRAQTHISNTSTATLSVFTDDILRTFFEVKHTEVSIAAPSFAHFLAPAHRASCGAARSSGRCRRR